MTEGGGPAIGSAAYRQLDGLHFECTVVDITYDHEHKPVMWTVQYADDDNTESVTDVSELNFDVQAVVDMRKHHQLFLDQFASFLPYLTPWERLTKCCVLCKSCQRATMQATLWKHVDLSSFWPSTTPVGRYVNTVLNRLVYHDVLDKTPVKSIVDTLVLDGLPVTDQDLWGLMRQTPLLTSLSLVGCPYISFHLFPMCQNLQTTLALETVDLYLTFVQHASVMDVRNKFHRVVSFTSSGLQSLSPDISSHLLAQYTVTTWSNDRILFVDKDRLVLDHPNACSDELYAWPFSLVPVFQGDVSPTITPKSNPLSSSTAFMFRSLAHAGRFLDDLRVPESLATLVHRMKSSQSTTPRTRSKPVDPFDEHAKQVFASLYAWKTSLQAQVDDLSVAVAKAKEEHHVALTDYNRAELQRRHVEKAANRAVLALSMGQASVSPPPSGVIVNRPGDLDLPPLPSPDAIVALATTLALNQFAVCDAFLGEAMAIALYETLDNLHTYGGGLLSFERGVLAGGKTGRNLRYEKPSVRGDDVVWLDGSEAGCPGIVKQTLRQLDRLVMERLANDELAECTLIRNKAMLTCYPGRGASYVKHCDNPNGNGRKVTAILYLNPAWVPAHGGELVIHHAHDTQHVVAPVLDRLLLFYSDARNPHEVRPTSAKRYAMTVWYMDWDEYTTTQVFADDDHNERTKIEREIEKFDAVAST